MSEFYTRLQATAERLIDQFGTTAVLHKQTAHNPEPWNPVITSVDHDVSVVKSNISIVKRDETLMREGDLLLIMYSEIEPTLKDALTVDGKKYQIIQTQPLKPADTVLYYEILVRA